MDVKKHGTAGVRDVSDVLLAPGQFPNQPAVYGAKTYISLFCFFPSPRDIVQYPLDFGAGKISIYDQPSFVVDHFRQALFFQLVTISGGSAVLPDNGIVKGVAGLSVPEDGGFPLVGYSYSGNLARFQILFAKDFGKYRDLGSPYFNWVMLYPACFGKLLLKILLGNRFDLSSFIKNNRP